MDEYVTIVEKYDEIINDRNTIRAKLVELGLAQSNDMLDALAAAIDSIVNQGAVQLQVKFGQTVAIPAGLHNGGGTVSGVAGDGDFGLQQKTITPTKKQQVVNEDEGYYGLSSVIVEAIPVMYQDVTPVTATPADTLAGKIIVLADGTAKAGTMPDNGTVNKTLDVATISYTIPAGKHSGTGTVSISLESKKATPTKGQQIIKPSTGKVLEQVTVEAIPDNFIDTTDADAVAAEILDGKFVYVDGERVEGTMPNIGRVAVMLQPSLKSYTIPEGYHNGEGVVNFAPVSGRAVPKKEKQVITPANGGLYIEVTIDPIPDKYQDVTGVTSTSAGTLEGLVFVDAEGNPVVGTMPNNGAVDETLDTSTTSVDVPAGYTPGGTVSIVTEEKSVTPAKVAQDVTPAAGKVLAKVSVAKIPDAYQDVSKVTATADKVLTGSVIVDAEGEEVEGTMPNRGAYSVYAAHNTPEITIPKGYHNGEGKVKIEIGTGSGTPSKEGVVCFPPVTSAPNTGVISTFWKSFTINPIPDEYQDVSGVTSTAAGTLEGLVFVDAEGNPVAGTMPDNGAVSGTMDGINTTSVNIPAGYTPGGTVTFDPSKIIEMLDSI